MERDGSIRAEVMRAHARAFLGCARRTSRQQGRREPRRRSLARGQAFDGRPASFCGGVAAANAIGLIGYRPGRGGTVTN